MRALLLLLALLLLPVRAEATVLFASGLDHCVADTANGGLGTFWDSLSGSQSVVTTGLDPDPGNLCALGFTAAVSNTNYVDKGLSTSYSTLYAGLHIKFTRCPTTRRDFIKFRSINFQCIGGPNSGAVCTVASQCPNSTCGEKAGALLSVEAVAGSTTKCLVKAFYESTDVSPGECSASATMDQSECGGPCTTSADCITYARSDVACTSGFCVNECDAANIDVGSSCLPGVYAQSTLIDTNTWQTISLGQANGSGSTAGSVTVSLWQGPTTGALAVQRGSATHKQGKCTGGTGTNTNGLACNVSGDCTGTGATCNIGDVVTIEGVRFGTDDTVASRADYVIDAVWVDDATPRVNNQIETLRPAGQDTAGANTDWDPTGCAVDSEWQCLNDGNAPDSNTTYLENGTAAKPTIAIKFATPAAPLPTPLGVSVAVVAEDAAAGGSNSATVDLEDFPTGSYGSVSSRYDAYDLENFPGTGGTSDPYYGMPSFFAPFDASAAAWTATSLANFRLDLKKTAGSADKARASTAVMNVLERLPDPPVPTVIPDRNRNGIKTVCIVGDSTWNQQAFHNALASGLLEPTNLIECAEDGGTEDDIVRDISIAGAANDILETAPALSSGWTCKAIKGSTGDTCDLVFLDLYANASIAGSLMADPAMDTGHKGQGTGLGYCDDNGGAQQGSACYCSRPSTTISRPLYGRDAYCRVRGSKWKSVVTTSPSYYAEPNNVCNCDTNADCKLTSGHADGVCVARRTPTPPAATRTPGDASPKVCATPSPPNALNANVTDDPTNYNVVPGCLSASGCTNGICIVSPNEQYITEGWDTILSLINARPTATTFATSTPPTPSAPIATPTPARPLPILVAPALPETDLRTNANPASAFPNGEQKAGVARFRAIARAEAAGIPWIDVGARFLRDCPNKRLSGFDADTLKDGSYNNETYCLKDGIHPTDYGDQVQGQLVTDCTTNTYSNTSGTVVSGTSDGVCGPSPTPTSTITPTVTPTPTPTATPYCGDGIVNGSDVCEPLDTGCTHLVTVCRADCGACVAVAVATATRTPTPTPTPTITITPTPTPTLTPDQVSRRCTQGKVSDNCLIDADCSTYHCDFSAAP